MLRASFVLERGVVAFVVQPSPEKFGFRLNEQLLSFATEEKQMKACDRSVVV